MVGDRFSNACISRTSTIEVRADELDPRAGLLLASETAGRAFQLRWMVHQKLWSVIRLRARSVGAEQQACPWRLNALGWP